MENIKSLIAEIKRLAENQRVYKLNRKTVNFPSNMERTYEPDYASYKVTDGKYEINILLNALHQIRSGKTEITHWPKGMDENSYNAKHLYGRIYKAVELYGRKEETVCTDK